ncbi:protein transport protein S31 [Stygiomarasmius scandens]|uniref:Protein transport protein SEC31 n=1 Tax=Marasmiellus scandens TaxID=2682957 RepID=A0ABR1IY76_9AGAR
MKLKEIHRTSTFAWSPSASLPLLATGTVAGALDESFSNESQLEIWAPDLLDQHEFDLGGEGQHGPKGFVKDTARFNRLTWGYVDTSRPQGVIAAGMENGELALWDPSKILAGADATESLILRNTQHTGPVRALDFNPVQPNLLASGAVAGEVYIWDLKDPSKPYTPGTRSTKLDDITSVAWNQQVQYVLAGASSTGYTVVWDLRGKREVVALAYGGGAGTLAGQMNAGNGLAVGGRRGMSAIAWHPDNATRLVTASEDDSSPIIMVWDLRNARAPEKILTGHEKGVLSLSWCKQDPDLLLSCGKDNRALCWNPQTSEIIGELPSADNWAFQVEWCPRNPDLLATAFFDGTVGIHSIQTTNESSASAAAAPVPAADGSDVFDVPGFSRSSQGGTLSLKQPPKWLRRPASASFGFGGKLVTVSNLSSAQGKNQSSVVHLRDVITENELVERAKKLEAALDGDSLKAFAEGKTTDRTGETWKALLSLFQADSRDELVTLLGFSKAEVAARVAEAVEKLKANVQAEIASSELTEQDIGDAKAPVVSFAEPEVEETPVAGEEVVGDVDALPDSAGLEKTPSEVSIGATSDATSAATRLGLTETESTTTVPSLFGDDNVPGIPNDGGDFFSAIGMGGAGDPARQVLVPHTNYGLDSSVAATIGSRPSSAASSVIKNNTFRIYPSDESETERLVTKALVLGDFESAVELCLSSDRFADALLLSVRGGPELLQKTQQAYFERQTISSPYLRLFQSIVTNDLVDIVQNADLQEWQEIFVVLCTFASKEEFSGLSEQLGRRLEFQYTIAKSSSDEELRAKAGDFRRYATLTYLAAGRLERLVNIWSEELIEEEAALVTQVQGTHYSAHAHALQTFVEKVTVFRAATKYVDGDLALATTSPEGPEAEAKVYKLSALYDKYFEYADLLASQGLVKEGAAFLKLTPADYKGSEVGDGVRKDLTSQRSRLLVATNAVAGPSRLPATAPITTTATASRGTYSAYAASTTAYGVQPAAQAPIPPIQASSYSTYAPQTQTMYSQPPPAPVPSAYPPQPNYVPAGGSGPGSSYSPFNAQNNLTQPPHLRQQPQPQSSMLPPPRASGPPSGPTPTAPPPPKRTENGGWNDAPAVIQSRPQSSNTMHRDKLPAITSPFPNAPSPSGTAFGSPNVGMAPPPRPGSRGVAPPPTGPPPRGASQMYPPPPRPPSGASGPGMPPPPRGPVQAGQTPPPPSGYARPPLPNQMQSPPGAAFAQARATPPPGPYARATPPPGQMHSPIQGGGPYAPPPGAVAQSQSQGPYAPPPGGQPSSQQPAPGPYAPPPVAQGPGSAPGSGPYAAPPPSMRPTGPLGAPGAGGAPPMASSGPPPGGSGSAPPPRAAPASKPAPPAPKYPPGDRSHIPEHALPAYTVLSEQLEKLKQTTPPNQKRLVDDLERRINPLFDALNCETLSKPVVDQLLVLTRAMEARDRPNALAIHVDLLTRGSQTDDIGLWMSGIKQLIMRL